MELEEGALDLAAREQRLAAARCGHVVAAPGEAGHGVWGVHDGVISGAFGLPFGE